MSTEASDRKPAIPGSFAIEAFDAATTTWKRWVQRLQGAFLIFGIKDDARVPYLLHYVGPTAFDVLCDRLDPDDPFVQPYDVLVQKLQEFYEPAPLEIAENYRFHQRIQNDGESVQQFVAALHKLSIHCKFGDYLKMALRNQFVFGLSNKKAQARLLERKDLNFDEAVKVAVTMELSEKSSEQMKKSSAAAMGVDYLKAGKKPHGKNAEKKPKHITKKFSSQNSSNLHAKNVSNTNVKCFRCGKPHLASKCTLNREIRCHTCGKQGHLSTVCFKGSTPANQLQEILSLEHKNHRDKFLIKLMVNEKPIEFEVDSGAAVTIVSSSDLVSFFPRATFHRTNLQLVSYCGRVIPCEGYITVNVRYNTMEKELNIYIVNGRRKPLMGREWIHLSAIKGLQAKLFLKSDASPVFIRARPVPFKLLPLVEKELDALEGAGIISKVATSKWATPIVPIVKSNGQIRICGDYKSTVNPQLLVDDHPLPTVDELFAKLANGLTFSKIDLKQAYLQLEIAPEHRECLTISTCKGLYQVNRLMYGIASGPTVWQREIENILQGIPGVAIFFDDIVITGETDKLHFDRLDEVLKRLHQYNIRINVEKSMFFMDKVNYCGYTINKDGVHKEDSKMEAIKLMPRPKNVSEVRAFTGMINYYGRFIPNLSTILHPLNELLRKNSSFIWSRKCELAFQKAKEAFTSNRVLTHFNSKLPLILATDASSYGVGAVLSHRYPDGSERVIQFASQTLSPTQQKYSQIDKEAYAIIYGIKKFFQFLYGNKFTLITDHRPLIQILSPTKSLPIYTAMRMQHYAIFLQGFNYSIQYKKSEDHANADCLSRLPANSQNTSSDVIDAFQMDTLDTLPISANKIAFETNKDTNLKKLLQALHTGKQIHKSDRFNIDQIEFNLHAGVIMRGHRVVIPKSLQPQILKELHSGHFGMVKMKELARSYCWWSKIDDDIENIVKNCANCNVNKNNVPKASIHHWQPSSAPMQRVHMDFAGPFLNKMFLIMIDAYSKWPEVHVLNDITANTTISKCRQIFAAFGLPRTLVTDNGRTFVSQEFQNFLRSNGIVHKVTAPYNPATNGQAERFVQTLKQALKRMNCNTSNINLNLSKILLQYRSMQHASTNKTPAEMFLGRKLSTRLNLIFPTKEAKTLNQNTLVKHFLCGERVACRNYSNEVKWKFGKITEVLGILHYKILLDDGRSWIRHINQIRSIGDKTPVLGNFSNEDFYWDSSEPSVEDQDIVPRAVDVPVSPQPESTDNQLVLRRTTRVRKKPEYYEP
ncbi:PREDICTED: uncharacterized protein K02A2.6-like [Cyphomyrmex costatus]|uniref:uncharacterized protein K02A2.6-like n=1 Tax=Cyphomyrmex costatus TaxID=456900 RepID=UPI00085239FA|nr:PREDICTED: uncharacterized protein K02A2.6-like [Cyphomyrmex costatus]